MAALKTYLVISTTPVVVEDPVFANSTSYNPGAVFEALDNNPSVQRLLQDEKITEVTGVPNQSGFVVVTGQPGPPGPTGPGAFNDLETTLGIGNFTGAEDIVLSTGTKIMGGRACFGDSTAASADGDLSAGSGANELSWNASTANLSATDGTRSLSWIGATGQLAITGLSADVDAIDVSGSVDGIIDINVTNSSTGTAARSRLLLTGDGGSGALEVRGSGHSGDPDTMILSSFSDLSGGLVISTNGAFPITFRTNTAARWQINSSGFLTASTDNAYDIGIAAMNRPRTLFLGTSLDVGQTSGSTTTGDIKAGDGVNEFSWDASEGLLTVPNLEVSGTTTTINSEVQTADNYILLNSDYTADTPQTGGLVFNVDPSATSFSVSDITSNVITVTAGDPSAALGAGDLILVQDPSTAANAGLYEVLSTTASTITIDATPAEPFSGNSLTDDATAQGTVVGVSVSLFETTTGGVFQSAFGSSAPLTRTSLSSFDFLNVGAATSAVSTGDLAASDGTRGLTYDASTGVLEITSNTGYSPLGTKDAIAIAGQNTDNRIIWITHANTANPGAPPVYAGRRSRGTLTSQSPAQSGDQLVSLLGQAGYGSNSFWSSGAVAVEATGTTSASSAPGRLLFATTSVGATALTTRWTVEDTGHLLAFADNTYDIGNSGALRPRTGYFGTSLNVGNGITPTTTNGDFVIGNGDGTAATTEFSLTSATGVVRLARGDTTQARYLAANTNTGGNANLTAVNDTGAAIIAACYGSATALAGATLYGFNSNLNFYVNSPDSAMIFNISGGGHPGTGWQIDSENAGRAFRPSNNGLLDIGTTSRRVRDVWVGGAVRGAASTLDLDVALTTTASEISAAINELDAAVAAAGGESLAQTLAIGNSTGSNDISISSGRQISGGRANFGSSTSATSDGDLSAGDGTRSLEWDTNDPQLTLRGTTDAPLIDASTDVSFYAHRTVGENIRFRLGTVDGLSSWTGTRANTSFSSPGALSADDVITQWLGQGRHSSGWGSVASINIDADAAFGSGSSPGRIRFATCPSGSAVAVDRWRINSGGHFLTETDNTYDIGTSGATRPRSGYFGTSLNVGDGITPSTSNGDIAAGDGTNLLEWDSSDTLLSVRGSSESVINSTGLVFYGRAAAGEATRVRIHAVTTATSFTGTRSNGTYGTPTALASGDEVTQFYGQGHTGSAFADVGSISIRADAAFAAGSSPGRIEFHTTPSASTTQVERWRIDNAGHFLAASDNAYDIGASGATRPRTGFFGTSVDVDGTVFSGSTTATRLSTTTGVDGTTTGVTALYTVPSGKTMCITKAAVRLSSVATFTSPPTIGIGVAAGEDDIFAPESTLGLDATTKVYWFSSENLAVLATSGQTISLGIDDAAVAGTYTIAVDLFGYEV